MSYNEDNSLMRPRMGDRSITLPITFDYSGGRSETKRQTIIWGVVFAIVCVIIAFGVIFNKEGSFFVNLILGILILVADMLVIRFVFMRESSIRKYYSNLEKTDYEQSFQDIWGIYDIDEEYPYYVRYRSGRSGLFIRLNKDVILGKYSESEFEHYEAIGDAYNIAGSSNISMCHVDYMDVVGSDERIQESFASLGDVSNTDLKDVLVDMFSHLQRQMNERVTTFDVYVFTYRGSDIAAWNTIQRILSCLMDANYVSYHLMDSNDLRDFFKTLFNLHEFSANSAMLNSFSFNSSDVGIIPIRVIHEDGSEDKLNMTVKEREDERKRQEEIKEFKSQEEKRRKSEKRRARNKKKVSEDEEIDLFE